MFCQNSACGTELASSYKICPNCGGKSFGSQQVGAILVPSIWGTISNKIASFFFHDRGGNANKPLPLDLKLVAIGIVVLLALAVFGYQFVKEREFQKQQQIAKIEIERKRIEEEAARQRQAENERLADVAEQARKEQEASLSREIEKISLEFIKSNGAAVLDDEYPLAFGSLVFRSAESRGVIRSDSGYTVTVRLNYLNLLDELHYLDIAFNFSEQGKYTTRKVSDFSDIIAPKNRH